MSLEGATQRYRSRTPRSAAVHEEALSVFPGGVTRSVSYFAPYPVYLARGAGCRAEDVDGNVYLDHLNNFGSLIHGHAHAGVTHALRERAALGSDFGTPTELHLTLARAIRDRVPAMERLRFTTSGTEAVLYAIRAARAFTGRTKILKFEGSYHGGYDSVSVSVDPGAGGPDAPRGKVGSSGLPPEVDSHTLVAPFNDLARAAEIIRRYKSELAAVIVEAVTVRGMIAAEPDFVRGLREVTREAGVLLVLDEVVTFRLARGGAQSLFGITPDMTTLGKIIGGGLPVGAFGGRADVMAGFDPSSGTPVHHSGTFAGNSVVMAAGLATLAHFEEPDIARLNALGDGLRDALRRELNNVGIAAQVTGLGSLAGLHFTEHPVRDYRSALGADREAHKLVHLALLNRSVLTRSGMSFFLSTAMSESEIDETANAVRGALDEVHR